MPAPAVRDYSGLVLGAEFCARHLPAPEAVAAAHAEWRSRGCACSVTTPLVLEGDLERVGSWVAAVARLVPGLECAFNDWGLLRWARARGLDLQPVAGRLLGRQVRGPRAMRSVLTGDPEAAAALRGSLWDDPLMAELLAELGIVRVELDLLLQGVCRPALPAGVGLSLCAPWLPVTLTPSCPWSDAPRACARRCREHPAVVQRDAEQPYPLWSRGNALFAEYEADPAPGELLALGGDRLIWAPEIPG